jgi:hypothetical protein
MDPARNRRLLEYFKDRHAWLLEADGDSRPPHLEPYSEEGSLGDRRAQVGALEDCPSGAPLAAATGIPAACLAAPATNLRLSDCLSASGRWPPRNYASDFILPAGLA